MRSIRRIVHASAMVLVALHLTACLTRPPAPAQPGAPASTQVLHTSSPAVFQAWSGVDNKDDEDELVRIARHGLVFSSPWEPLRMSWLPDAQAPYEGFATRFDQTAIPNATARKNRLRQLNPDLVLLVSIELREGRWIPEDREGPGWWEKSYFPHDSEFWLRDGSGAPIPGWGEDADGDGSVQPEEALTMLLDFRKEGLQDLIAARALTVKQSGLYQGIMFDWWFEAIHGAATDPVGNGWTPVLTPSEEWEARLSILRKVRALVGDDFLILVNSNYRTLPGSAPYVNGVFMECYKDGYARGYTRSEILAAEGTLQWAEANLKEPRINCLEGWRVVDNYLADRDGRIAERSTPVNLRWMRLFTTMSLTLSDGYVLFGDDNALPAWDHIHNWYDLWDVDLGQAVSAKGVRYRDIEGLYLREFEHGWAVYNRSGIGQSIRFPVRVTRSSTGLSGRTHEVADMDGEVFLRR